VRAAILMLALAFAAVLGVFTARDLATHGPTLPGVAGAVIVVLFVVALTGALLHPPRR
jgi:heme A synthase